MLNSKDFGLEELKEILKNPPGIVPADEPENNIHPLLPQPMQMRFFGRTV